MIAVCYFMALTWWWIDFTRLSTGHWERYQLVLSKITTMVISTSIIFITIIMVVIHLDFLRDGCGNFLFIDSKWLLQKGDEP